MAATWRFGRAVNAGVRPTLFPVVEISLGLLQRFETKAFQRRSFGMANASFDLTFIESHRMQVVWDRPGADSA